MDTVSMMLTPRWYQQEAVTSLFRYFEGATGNPVVSLPTGAGKSFVIAMFLHGVLAQYPGQRIIVATHVKELIEQSYAELKSLWPEAPVGIYSAGLKRRDMFSPITFAGIASIVNIIEVFGHIDLIIIDECHLLGPSSDGMYMRVITELKQRNPFLKVIGLTATAWRSGMGLLTNGEIFTDICYDICNVAGFKRLFDDYHLVPPRAKRTDIEIDASKLQLSNNGDYTANSVAASVDEQTTWAALNESLNKNPDRRCRLVFAAGVENAILAAEMLRYLGFRASAVHSRMSNNERDGIIAAYRAGELDVLTNNGIATTGLNVKQIDHIIQLRAVKSVGLNVQMLGRGMRAYEVDGYRKLDCIVSDHAGNAKRLGPIDDPYIPKMKGKTAGDMPVKICTACDSYNHCAARVCAYCGEPFQFAVQYKATADENAVLVRSDLPIYENYEVAHVFYTQHIKRNAGPNDKPSIKATYNCGLQSFIEFKAVESESQFIRRNFSEWWKQRFPHATDIPQTTSEAMQVVDKLIPPKTIKVWVNRRYPEIVGYGY